MRGIAFVLVWANLCGLAFGADYFLSAKGDDASPGAKQRPWKTLERVNRKDFRPGDRLLLEGPSGGGKSTLAAVLASLRVADHGLLLLEGFDRQAWGDRHWRQHVALAPQFHENHIFGGTFAFNVLMGKRWPPSAEDLSDADAICRELGLGDLIGRMPDGMNQLVGEGGWRLSHGERSRVYIARALLQRADLVILDESFGAVDPENLSRAMRCALARATTLMVIAHP